MSQFDPQWNNEQSPQYIKRNVKLCGGLNHKQRPSWTTVCTRPKRRRHDIYNFQ